MRGAGGSEGGIGRFLLGFAMLGVGLYLFLSSIWVGGSFWGGVLFGLGGFGLTTGMMLIPFILGVGLIFYDARSIAGWALACGSILLIVVGILRSLQFHLRPMSLWDLLLILVLTFGGAGLFASSLRDFSRTAERSTDER